MHENSTKLILLRNLAVSGDSDPQPPVVTTARLMDDEA